MIKRIGKSGLELACKLTPQPVKNAVGGFAAGLLIVRGLYLQAQEEAYMAQVRDQAIAKNKPTIAEIRKEYRFC